MKINQRKLDVGIARSGLSVMEFSKSAGVCLTTISKIRNNPKFKPELRTVGRIARALGVDVEEIVEGVA